VEAGLVAVAAEPLRESAHRVLIEAYLAEGNRAQALTQFHSCRSILLRELNIEPSPATRATIAAAPPAGGADRPVEEVALRRMG